MPLIYRLGAVLLTGISLSFIQAPYHLWFLIFPCLGGFYFLFNQAENKKQAFATGFLFSFGYHVAGLYWIGNALLVEGNPYQWAWPLAVIALPALLALFTALYITIAHRVFAKNTLSGFVGFCALLALSEWVRGYAFTGFPWNLYGYSWISVLPIAQIVSFVGPYGLALLTILWGASLGYLFTSARLKVVVALVSILLMGGSYIFGTQRLKQNVSTYEGVNVHIVQPNIAQKDKWDNYKLRDNFEKHIGLSSAQKSTNKNIIIWPETALPPVFLQSEAVHERIRSVLNSNDMLLSGALQVSLDKASGTPSYHNALMLWDSQNTATRLYSKSHLVPFGEYIPFQQYIPLKPVVEFSGFERGHGTKTIQYQDYPSFSPLICYEIIFPHQSVVKNNPRPDYILTVTNDAWYGDSPGPYQHFVQAQFRAIEQGIPVVRSANTGVSGLIDPYGRVVQQSPLMEGAAITAPLPLKIAENTFYGMYGDRIFFALLMLCLFGAISFRPKGFS